MALRFFLERNLVAIMFSAQEIELNLWKNGERDTYWSELIDEDKGLFSHRFCRAFFPDLTDERKHFKVITEKVYRECSEYVHGNNAILSKLPDSLEYSSDLNKEWNQTAGTVMRCVWFALCLRYLKSLSKEQKSELEQPLNDFFKSVTPIIETLN